MWQQSTCRSSQTHIYLNIWVGFSPEIPIGSSLRIGFEGYGRRRRVGSNALICQRFDAPVLWEALLYPLSSHESAFGLQVGSQHIFTTQESKWDQSKPIPVTQMQSHQLWPCRDPMTKQVDSLQSSQFLCSA